MAFGISTTVTLVVVSWLALTLWQAFSNCYLHPLKNVPGPGLAKVSKWYRAYQELALGKCWNEHIHELHERYGDIVRVAPDELHFSNPKAYIEIYSNSKRWDKEEHQYRSFGSPCSSFGFLTYSEAKTRRDVLMPLFSRRAIVGLQGLVWKNVDRFCAALAAQYGDGKSSDMLCGLRCFAVDTILEYCFAQDVKAIEAPDFQAPIVIAMDAAVQALVVFRQFGLVQQLLTSLPGWLTKAMNPALAGLVDLQQLLGEQVARVVKDPAILEKAPHPIIYHRLLDPELNKAAGVPSPASLRDEAQSLLFGGSDSPSTTIMFGLCHIIQQQSIYQKLKAEVVAVWPDVEQLPKLEDLEQLPYLTAVIKESLRVAPGIVSGPLRVVPPSGGNIASIPMPGGTIVSMSAIFVHFNETVFPDPKTFWPERWMQSGSGELEKWLVPFSRGPRSCFGQNLAMCELYIAFAALVRKFDMALDGTKEEDLKYREAFGPTFLGKHMKAFCKPVEK